ncbi:MAG TPA: ABC transporter permease subunit [Virgibacillus sp.]|nr:ABC transporter permease subunit [Virgibacillus sp.]
MTWAVKVKQLFKHPLFICGFSFLFLLFLASVIHAIFFNGVVPETPYLYEDGVIAKKAPFSPLEVPPLGTEQTGKQLIFMLLQGAKFTIGIAVVVAAFRMLFSSIIGLCFADFLSKFNKWITGLVNGFYYIPIALICFVLLNDILVIHGYADESPYTFFQRSVFEFAVLTVVALPTTSLLIGNQIRQVYNQEFITAARLLGGRRWHVLKRHVLPHMWPRLIIQFVQEIVQVLVLLIHLGFFRLLFGGTLKIESGSDTIPDIFISLSSEWSGLIGNAFRSLENYPWLFLSPIIAFMLTILAFNLIVKGMENVFFGNYPKRKHKSSKQTKDKSLQENISFEFIHEK